MMAKDHLSITIFINVLYYYQIKTLLKHGFLPSAKAIMT